METVHSCSKIIQFSQFNFYTSREISMQEEGALPLLQLSICFYTLKINRSLAKQMMRLERKYTYLPYTLVGPTVTRWVQDPQAVYLLNNRLLNCRGHSLQRKWLNWQSTTK